MILLAGHKRSTGDAFKRQEASWRRDYAEACSLKEAFPGVEQIVARMEFVDVKGIGIYSPQIRTYLGPAKAFFSLPCPRSLCLDGGFHLDAVVKAMVAARKRQSGGSLECAGWTDPARPPHAHCLLRLDYQIDIEYHPS
jgi:hypothetical protein